MREKEEEEGGRGRGGSGRGKKGIFLILCQTMKHAFLTFFPGRPILPGGPIAPFSPGGPTSPSNPYERESQTVRMLQSPDPGRMGGRGWEGRWEGMKGVWTLTFFPGGPLLPCSPGIPLGPSGPGGPYE